MKLNYFVIIILIVVVVSIIIFYFSYKKNNLWELFTKKNVISEQIKSEQNNSEQSKPNEDKWDDNLIQIWKSEYWTNNEYFNNTWIVEFNLSNFEINMTDYIKKIVWEKLIIDEKLTENIRIYDWEYKIFKWVFQDIDDVKYNNDIYFIKALLLKDEKFCEKLNNNSLKDVCKQILKTKNYSLIKQINKESLNFLWDWALFYEIIWEKKFEKCVELSDKWDYIICSNSKYYLENKKIEENVVLKNIYQYLINYYILRIVWKNYYYYWGNLNWKLTYIVFIDFDNNFLKPIELYEKLKFLSDSAIFNFKIWDYVVVSYNDLVKLPNKIKIIFWDNSEQEINDIFNKIDLKKDIKPLSDWFRKSLCNMWISKEFEWLWQICLKDILLDDLWK